jgi:hypothetical protein
MSNCYLSASGADFDVDTFLSTSPLKKLASTFNHSETLSIKRKPIKKYSGFSITISNQEEQLEPQIESAIDFFQHNGIELEKLAVFPGVDDISLVIGLFWLEDTVCYPLSLPPEFLLLVGKYNVSIELYIYATSMERGNYQQTHP